MNIDMNVVREKLDKRRRWNIEHLDDPHKYNAGIVQALMIINDIATGNNLVDGYLGDSYSYSDMDMYELGKKIADGTVLELPLDPEIDAVMRHYGGAGDFRKVIYPDGCVRICIRESVAVQLRKATGKIMEDKGWDGNRVNDYIENGITDAPSYELEDGNENDQKNS